MRPILLYFYTAPSSFVEKDLRILTRVYDVKPFVFSMVKKKSWPLLFIRQKLFLFRHLPVASLVVCQFAGMHAFLPILMARFFRKKSVVVAGGTDCVGFPEINYGNFASPVNSFFTRTCYKKCNLILPVHQTLVEYNYTYMPSVHPKQGIRYFMPQLRTPVQVISNGYDSELWSRKAAEKDPLSFATAIAYSNSRFTDKLKGLDLFRALAQALPHCNFYVVGPPPQSKPAISNLHYVSNLKPKDLARFLAGIRFYVQLSVSEGFPNALSEAMLCECVPIVSAVGGMPHIVQNCGLIIQKRDKDLLIAEVKKFMESADKELLGQLARKRIADHYPLSARENNLLKALNEL